MIGDRLYTDIACGINARTDTCFVLSERDRNERQKRRYKTDICFRILKNYIGESKMKLDNKDCFSGVCFSGHQRILADVRQHNSSHT